MEREKQKDARAILYALNYIRWKTDASGSGELTAEARHCMESQLDRSPRRFHANAEPEVNLINERVFIRHIILESLGRRLEPPMKLSSAPRH